MRLSYRFGILWGAALAVVLWYWLTDPNGGAETLMRLQWLAWIVVVGAPVYLLRRAFHPEARSAAAYRRAMESPIGAGLVFLGLALLTGLLFIAFSTQARAQALPDRALTYLPMLRAEIAARWPDTPLRSALAAQVEQETCPSLKSDKCWNPRAELRTEREYGFGLGQLTVTKRFDNFAAARGLDPSLRAWAWEERYDAVRQLRTLVLMDRDGYLRLRLVADSGERLAMALAAYNGGLGGVLADRRLCGQIAGCDPARWFGHVERHSLKARVAAHGYSRSFFDINRGYVRAAMIERRPRYAAWFGER